MNKNEINYKKIESMLSRSDDSQKAAINKIKGPLLLLAGPGSGKSTVLKIRTSKMIIEHDIDPQSILMVTFTNKAANELLEDMISLLGREIAQKINISTFHQLGNKILKENSKDFNLPDKINIIQGEEQEKIIKSINKSVSLKPQQIISQIGLWKNDMKLGMEGYTNLRLEYKNDATMQSLVTIYEKYQNYLEQNYVLDNDDSIVKTILCLKNNPQILKKYQAQFNYIMIDEYQDTNEAQYNFTNMLVNQNQNICVVGDPDQGIYEWRGANSKIINRFVDENKANDDFEQLLILGNYRSQGNIIEASDQIVHDYNFEHKPKKSIPQDQNPFFDKQFLRDRELIYDCETLNAKQEAMFILRNIREQLYVNYAQKDFSLNDIAIFARSAKHLEHIERQIREDNDLLENKMAYQISKMSADYQRKDIEYIVNFLILCHNPHDNKAFIKILKLHNMNGLQREYIEKYATYLNTSIFSLIKSRGNKQSIGDFSDFDFIINSIIKFIPIVNRKKNSYYNIILKINQEVLKNSTITSKFISIDKYIIKFAKFISQFENNYFDEEKLNFYLKNEDKYEDEIKQINEKIQKIQDLHLDVIILNKSNFINQIETILQHSIDFDQNKPKLSLMTMHSSKGLEFEVVYVCCMEENLFPGKISIKNNDIDAERRLAFVAYTRAKQKLYLTHAKSRDQFFEEVSNPKSRFITEIDKKFIKEIKFEATAKNEYKIGEIVTHSSFGEGVITNVVNNIIYLKVDTAEYKVVKTSNKIKRKENNG